MFHFGSRLLPSWRRRVADVILCLRPLLYVGLGSHVSPAEHDIIVSSATPTQRERPHQHSLRRVFAA